jgi:hypothetical protein
MAASGKARRAQVAGNNAKSTFENAPTHFGD